MGQEAHQAPFARQLGDSLVKENLKCCTKGHAPTAGGGEGAQWLCGDSALRAVERP